MMFDKRRTGSISLLGSPQLVSDPGSLPAILAAHSATVLSIDLFDTLVYREVQCPEDIFRLQFHEVQRLRVPVPSMEKWVRLRKHHEHALAEVRAPGEIQLDEIYAALTDNGVLSLTQAQGLMATELELERAAIQPYLAVVQTLESIRAHVKIVVTTDTYLPEVFIDSVLKTILPFDYTLLCSSKTGQPKRSGLAYALLQRMHPGESIVHIGDNDVVDRQHARHAGLTAYTIRWPRQRWLDTQTATTAYQRSLGILTSRTPKDVEQTSAEPDYCFIELAWRWSVVMTDFLIAVREYATRIEASDIWFLSRDCEAMNEALKKNADFLSGFDWRYVPASRAACYPLMANYHTDCFRRWTGRDATLRDVENGELACAYYRSLLGVASKRILLVDIGWKGRLQKALATCLPTGLEMYGFYFSMEPNAEVQSVSQAETFLPWDTLVFHQAVVESLSGFVGPSCIGFEKSASGGIAPLHRSPSGDRAPDAYAKALRKYLECLLGSVLQEAADARSRPTHRRHLVQSICMFPDRVLADCFDRWVVSTNLAGSDEVNLINARGASLMARMFGLAGDGNMWPAGAIWSVTRKPFAVRLLQRLRVLRVAGKRWLKSMLRHTGK